MHVAKKHAAKKINVAKISSRYIPELPRNKSEIAKGNIKDNNNRPALKRSCAIEQ